MPGTGLDAIEHVVLLMLENRSYDHALGAYKPGDGIVTPPRTNPDSTNSKFPQAAGALRLLTSDLKHELPNVAEQLSNGNQGFVRDYEASFPHEPLASRAEVMKFHDWGTLPALHTLADNFCVCDQWFASVPGPTWPNRLFALSGTSLGRVHMPEGLFNWNWHWYDQTTLFDRLNQAKKSWGVYVNDFPLSLLLTHQLEPSNLSRYHRFQKFHDDAAGPASEFPSFSLIEPAYFQPHASDDHPPHDILGGETLIADVYNAIHNNEALWNSTLLVILFDEHGGLYDHVAPPSTIAPDHHSEEFHFKQLGVRVPAVLVSPWVKKGVLGRGKGAADPTTVFDHTSLLNLLVKHFKLGPLGARTAQANLPLGAFVPALRTDVPGDIFVPASQTVQTVPRQEWLSGHQAALVALSTALETKGGEPAERIVARLHGALTGLQGQVEAAIGRFEALVKW